MFNNEFKLSSQNRMNLAVSIKQNDAGENILSITDGEANFNINLLTGSNVEDWRLLYIAQGIRDAALYFYSRAVDDFITKRKVK